MRSLTKKPVAIVLFSWIAVLVLSALSSFGPVHRNDIPTYWSPQFFLTTVLGPLSAFAWPNPTTTDLVLSVIVALAMLASTIWLIRRPSKFAAVLFITLTCWVLLGLSTTYAWV